MPRMDGFEIADKVRATWPLCKIIFLTGHDTFENAYQALQYQDVRFVLKAEGYEIILSGNMTYEGMINYVAEVPVTPKMVSQDIYKYVQNARLRVLIEGPVSKPRISRKSMDETLSNLVKEAAKNLLVEKGGDLLKQLFKNR